MQPLPHTVCELICTLDTMRAAMRDGKGASTEQFTALLDTIDVEAALRELEVALGSVPPRAKILPFPQDTGRL
jgi:hypothetical protein